jgi:hypothetical protein
MLYLTEKNVQWIEHSWFSDRTIKLHQSPSSIEGWIKRTLKKNKRLAIACSSKGAVKHLYKRIKKWSPGLAVLALNSDSPTHHKDLIKNVNETWTQYDVVLYSPVVGTGVSFDVVNHFDHIVLYAEHVPGIATQKTTPSTPISKNIKSHTLILRRILIGLSPTKGGKLNRFFAYMLLALGCNPSSTHKTSSTFFVGAKSRPHTRLLARTFGGLLSQPGDPKGGVFKSWVRPSKRTRGPTTKRGVRSGKPSLKRGIKPSPTRSLSHSNGPHKLTGIHNPPLRKKTARHVLTSKISWDVNQHLSLWSGLRDVRILGGKSSGSPRF